MIIIIDKQTGREYSFHSLTDVAKYHGEHRIGIKIGSLYNYFSKSKSKKYENKKTIILKA